MNAVWSDATSLWALPATTSPPPRGRRDRALAAVVLAGVAAEAVLRDDLVWRPLAIGFGCGLAIAVLLRRAHPLAAAVFGFGGVAVLDLATSAAGADPVLLYSGAAVLVLAYALLRWGRGRDAVVGLAVMAAAPGRARDLGLRDPADEMSGGKPADA